MAVIFLGPFQRHCYPWGSWVVWTVSFGGLFLTQLSPESANCLLALLYSKCLNQPVECSRASMKSVTEDVAAIQCFPFCTPRASAGLDPYHNLFTVIWHFVDCFLKPLDCLYLLFKYAFQTAHTAWWAGSIWKYRCIPGWSGSIFSLSLPLSPSPSP